MRALKTAALISLTSAVFTAPVMAYDAGDFILRAGSATVAPKSQSANLVGSDVGETNTQASANNDTQLGLSFTYMLSDKLGVEVLAATPFSHKLEAKGDLAGKDIGTVKQLPPTVSLQYYPLSRDSQWQPYVGIGINYTTFFNEKTAGDIEGLGYNDLSLDDSFGLAAQVGVDYLINDHWGVNFSAMYADIDTTATLKGANGALGSEAKVDYNLDPVVYRVSAVYRF